MSNIKSINYQLVTIQEYGLEIENMHIFMCTWLFPLVHFRMGHLTIDRCLMVYDLRYLKTTAPMQMSLDPMFLRFVPTYSNRLAVVSQVSVGRETYMSYWVVSCDQINYETVEM